MNNQETDMLLLVIFVIALVLIVVVMFNYDENVVNNAIQAGDNITLLAGEEISIWFHDPPDTDIVTYQVNWYLGDTVLTHFLSPHDPKDTLATGQNQFIKEITPEIAFVSAFLRIAAIDHAWNIGELSDSVYVDIIASYDVVPSGVVTDIIIIK